MGLHPHSKARREKRLDGSNAFGEMRVRIPPLERSLGAAVSSRLVASTLSKFTANAAEDYMVFNTLGRGFESRQAHQMRACSSDG